jgi:hypothetical protein
MIPLTKTVSRAAKACIDVREIGACQLCTVGWEVGGSHGVPYQVCETSESTHGFLLALLPVSCRMENVHTMHKIACCAHMQALHGLELSWFAQGGADPDGTGRRCRNLGF